MHSESVKETREAFDGRKQWDYYPVWYFIQYYFTYMHLVIRKTRFANTEGKSAFELRGLKKHTVVRHGIAIMILHTGKTHRLLFHQSCLLEHPLPSCQLSLSLFPFLSPPFSLSAFRFVLRFGYRNWHTARYHQMKIEQKPRGMGFAFSVSKS